VEQLDAKQREEQALRLEKEQCETKVDLANNLINKLGGEKENWVKQLNKRRGEKECVVGDSIICSGYLAYLGVFIASYRKECSTEWTTLLKKFDITCSYGLSLVSVLGDPVKISEW
jgi:dynein heavy chain